jgi:hypothetical protein
MKFGVHIPAWQRWPLLKVVLQHLERLNAALSAHGHELVVSVAGSEGRDLEALVAPYADYVDVPNRPLGPKVNAAVTQLAVYSPDACIGLGSDDFVTIDLVLKWAELIEQGWDYLGVLDGYMYDLHAHRIVHWLGYDNEREGESIGPGRCMSSSLLDRVNWEPFGNVDRSLDGSLEAKIKDLSIRRWVGAPAPVVDVKMAGNLNPMPPGVEVPLPGVWLRETLGDETAEALADLRRL